MIRWFRRHHESPGWLPLLAGGDCSDEHEPQEMDTFLVAMSQHGIAVCGQSPQKVMCRAVLSEEDEVCARTALLLRSFDTLARTLP